MLLDAVEQYGFGNWDDVASHVESRSAEECQDHYVTFYVNGSIGRETIVLTKSPVKDHSCPEGGPLSPSITTPISPSNSASRSSMIWDICHSGMILKENTIMKQKL